MSQKILYFTAAPVATSAELVQIATLKAIAASPYEVSVMCGTPRARLTGVKLSAVASDNSYNDAGATITASTISALAVDNSINDSGNGFITAGFQVGDEVTTTGFTGSTANNATRIATAVTAAKITFSGDDGATIVDDTAGESVTASAPGRFLLSGFKVKDRIFVRGFTGAVANNINAGVITSLTATKMICGGTDGDVIENDSAGESVTISTLDSDAMFGDVAVLADFTAGTVPEAYKTSGTPIYTAFDVSNPPDVPALIDTQTVLSSGETIALDTAGTVTVTVAAGAVSAADVAATEYVVTHADTLSVAGHDVTFAVSAHALTGTIPATKAIIANGDATTLGGKAITLAVGTNALGVATLTATDAKLVVHGNTTDSITGSGTRATFAVVEGVLSIVLSTP